MGGERLPQRIIRAIKTPSRKPVQVTFLPAIYERSFSWILMTRQLGLSECPLPTWQVTGVTAGGRVSRCILCGNNRLPDST